jgi:dipeptidyl aminopeptidase/acylaminoacyl peptidase
MGKIGLSELLFMRAFAKSGYVVLGSQYRGNDGGEGRDEFGGRDVDDVLNLVPLARELGNVDLENVYMVGHSRGGMMVYLALKRGMRVAAAVAWGAPTDLEELGRERPAMVRYVYSEIIPHFLSRPADALRARSALSWPERLETPLLLLHGDADRRVPARQAIELAARLKALGRPCELILFPGGDHVLSNDLDEAIEKMKEFFRDHRARPPVVT